MTPAPPVRTAANLGATFGLALGLALGLAAAGATPARAADTTEAFDVGASDVEFHTSVEGLGLAGHERGFTGEMVLGYGILERLSAVLGTTLASDGRLNGGAASPYVGLFATPLDRDHVDLDLALQLALDGDHLHVVPAFELNWDADPDQLSWGLYLRSGVDIGGAEPGEPAGLGDLVWTLEATAGAYWTVREGHQLLLELDGGAPLHPRDEARPVELGGVALGYNVAVHDAVEIISQVWLDLPQTAADPLSAAITTGFIATLP